MRIEINSTIKKILNQINNNGYEAYLIGGAVRDTLLSQKSNDYDICTNMPLTKLKELYPKFVIMKPNNNRNTGVIIIDKIVIEISEYKGNNLIEDLSNRDFTINAIAQDKDGNIIDPFNGIEALNNQEISLIQENGEAFLKDPLRILRAIRIAAKMNFKIDDNCHNQMLKHKEKLDNIPSERIYRELIQLLITDNPAHYIRENIEVIFQILPELKPMYKFEQHNKWHIYDVLEHTLKVLENTPKNIYLRIAALFHDIGKPSKFFMDEDGVGHFYGHPQEGATIFAKIATRLKIDNKTRKIVKSLIEKHDMTFSKKPEKIYEFIKENGIDFVKLLFELKKADNLGQNLEMSTKTLNELAEIEALYQEYILRFENLSINTEKIIELGIRGKKIKIVLDDIRKKIVTNNLSNTETEIIGYVKDKYRI